MSAATPTLPVIQNLISRAFKNRRVMGFESLAGGLINTNLRVRLDNDESVVLRIYRDGADSCRKEVALHQLLGEMVPVASILYAEPEALESSIPFAILEYVDALTFQQLKRSKDRKALAEAASSAGKTLATFGRYQFATPGRILVDSDRLSIGERFVEGDNGISRLIISFLESSYLQRRINTKLDSDLRKFFWDWSPKLAALTDDRNLVHCDFGDRNILVSNKSGHWQVSAVLDWELAISGSPLLDVGHFLRYDYSVPLREPHFSNAFVEHGGYLPDDWQKIVRVIDLTGLVECLTHERLPTEVESEIIKLIQATLRDVS